jgi:hypothetical protein
MKAQRRPFLPLAAALLLVPALASAQPAPETFGVDDLQVVVLSHLEFVPQNATQTYFSTCCVPDSYRRPTGGFHHFYAPLHAGVIPNGARIEQIDFFLRDLAPEVDADISGNLCRSWIGLGGSGFGGECVSVATSGTPGDTVITLTPDLTVQYAADVDANGTTEAVTHVLVVQFGVNDTPTYSVNLRLRGARILYRRQVTPAPAAASFNDVPTDHAFFQFIEALAASGITAGCGSGNYCPDEPLTRGQMAVFLAKALGLHWPSPPGPPL